LQGNHGLWQSVGVHKRQHSARPIAFAFIEDFGSFSTRSMQSSGVIYFSAIMRW